MDKLFLEGISPGAVEEICKVARRGGDMGLERTDKVGDMQDLHHFEQLYQFTTNPWYQS